jgi:hypothetical protein
MLLVCGLVAGTGTTGTLYEPGETPPTYRGAPTATGPYTWVCDTFYRVESGGYQLTTDKGTIQVAFERPTIRGFEQQEQALTAAKSHIRDQFLRIGIQSEPDFYINSPEEAGHTSPK